MTMQITFLERCKALGIADKNLPSWLDEIETLRKQNKALEADKEEASRQYELLRASASRTQNNLGNLVAERDELKRQLAELTEWNNQIGCTNYELRKELAEYKADAAKWRAHQKRKQEVIAAGMGRKILRDLETHDALPAFYAAMKEASAEPVYYEYRAWFGENTVKPGWGDWERVKPRNALCTIDDAVNELQQYISAGYKYQLRELYEHPPAMKGATE